MKEMDLEKIEKELKKRWAYPYQWFRKQNNLWDSHTHFIYETSVWEDLIPKMKHTVEMHQLNKKELFYYTINRWYNFWGAMAVEQIFSQIDGVVPMDNRKEKEVDFVWFGIPFDHKTSVFPKQFQKTFDYAQSHKAELIEWLYKNQSAQKRHHFKNRLFLVVYDKNGEHWKLKAEIGFLKQKIEKYAGHFSPDQLHSFTFAGTQKTVSDIIWAVR